MFDTEKIKKDNPIDVVLDQRGIEIFPDGDERFKVCCPLPGHDDQNPSFTVYRAENRYHCFGCGKSGDVIRLIQELDGIGFCEACQRLGGTTLKSGEAPSIRRSWSSPAEGEREFKRQLETEAKNHREEILQEFTWTPTSIEADSPVQISDQSQVQFLQLFDPDDTVWIGRQFDSNLIDSANRFRFASDWINLFRSDSCSSPGPLICPSVFREGVCRRRKIDVRTRRYLVIECDKAIGKDPETEEEKRQNKAACGAITRWMVDRLGMELVAVVDSGNKSLHSWFKMPPDELFDELKIIAEPLGIDTTVLKRASQPVRFPGGCHEKTGKPAKLIYLDLSGVMNDSGGI